MRNGKVVDTVVVRGSCHFFRLYFFFFDTRGSWTDDRFISTFQIIMVRAHASLATRFLGLKKGKSVAKQNLCSTKIVWRSPFCKMCE